MGRTSWHRAHTSWTFGLGDGGAATFAADQLGTDGARQQPDTPFAIEDAHDPPAPAEQPDQTGRVEPGPGVVTAPVDHLEGCPSGPFLGPAGSEQPGPGPGQQLDTGAGAHHHAGHAGPPGPLGRHHPGVPGRRLFLLERLLVAVEHHDGGQAGTGSPRRAPRPDDDRGTGGRLGPLAGNDGDGQAKGPQPPPQRLGQGQRRPNHQARTGRGRAQHHRKEVRGRWQPQNGPPSGQRIRQESVFLGVRAIFCDSWRRDARFRNQLPGQPSHREIRRRGSQKCRPGPGPPPGRPVGQCDDLRRRPMTGDLGDGPQRHRRGRNAPGRPPPSHQPAARSG